MEKTIIPAQCTIQKLTLKDGTVKEVPPSFEGNVTIRLPSMPEFMRYKAKFGRHVIKSDDAVETDQLLRELFAMDVIAEVAESTKPNWVSVNLKEISTGHEIKTVEDLVKIIEDKKCSS